MSRSVLVIENDPKLEGTGRLGEALERSGLPWRSTQAWVDDVGTLEPADFSAIVAMGGEMHALDDERFPYLAREARLLEEAVERDVPVLGICLGGQLLARSLGATVQPAGVLEGGWVPISPAGDLNGDPVLGHLKEPTGVFSWHVDIFDLPEGATQLATGEVTAQQAFRYGRAWGLQFHPEVDGDLFESWLDAHPALDMSDEEKDRLRAEVRAGSDASGAFIERLFDGFLSQARAASN
jgi:GMP synthase (glutamine-hydrolysing)